MREFEIGLVNDEAARLLAALLATSFSAATKKAVWSELLDDTRFLPGPKGVSYLSGPVAADAGHVGFECHLGGAGKALAAAFNALAESAK